MLALDRCSAILALAVVWASLGCGDRPRQLERLNVLFIAVDDLRPELGAYGAPVFTPSIDRLAAGGIRFDRAYTEVAACAASRATMLTGAYSHRTGVYTMSPAISEANPELTTMPRVFKDAGYQTVEIGKFLHSGNDAPDAWSRPSWMATNLPHYESPENRDESGKRRYRRPLLEAIDVPDVAYTDGRIADRAIEELGQLAHEPFFLAVGFVRPHLPFICPKRYWDLYDIDRIGVPDAGGMSGVAPEQFHGNYELAFYDTGRPIQPREMILGYRACVSYVDAQIGRLLQALERLELAERTIVVLWGDHGWHLGEHGIWGKFTTLEPSLRVPLILRVPGVTAGQSTMALVESVDILPTLCELTDIATPTQVQGISLVPLLRDPERTWKRAVFGSRRWSRELDAVGMTVRTARYRFVRWRRDDGTSLSELYDHETDPSEYVNLANDADEGARVVQLNAMLDAWLRGEPVGHP